jgi:serine protease Do
MRRAHLIVFAMLLPLSTALASAPPRVLGTASLPDVVAPLLPAVVSISVLKQNREPPPEHDETTKPAPVLGSGFIIDPDGSIVTNRHVIADAYRITVTLDDGTSYPARLLGTNALPDLALLKIDASHPLPAVSFGDSNALRIGDTVVVIGNPLGLASSISVGVVSALNRNLDQTMIDDFIQTDAAINPGNSGGPMFNLKGEVVGVNWALLAPGRFEGSVGIGLAIPSRDVAFVVDQLRRYGWWHAGFAGMRLQQITPEIAMALGLSGTGGGIVASIWPDGPAEAAGITEGDVVLEFNHRHFPDVRALRRYISETAPQTKVPVLLWRWRHGQTVDLTVDSWPPSAAALDPAGQPVVLPSDEERPLTPTLGLTMSIVTDAQRKAQGLAGGRPGVVVVAVAVGGFFLVRRTRRRSVVTKPEEQEDKAVI